VYVIELGQLARRPVDGAPVSQDAELPKPGVVWGELVPAPAGDSLVPIQVGPPAGEVRLDSEERGAVHRPRVSTVEAGFFRWDLATEQVTLEPDIRRRHGLPGEGPVTVAELLARVPEEDVPSLVAALREMMAACGTYQVEYRVMDADGMLRSMEARGRMAAGPDGHPAEMTGFVMDTTTIWASREAERRRLRQGAERTALTQKFTAAMASAITVDDTITAAMEGLAAYGANGLVMLADQDGRRETVARFGFAPEAASALAGLPSGSPVADVIATGQPLFIGSDAYLGRHYPELARLTQDSPQQAWAVMPVPVGNDLLVVCLLGFAAVRDFAAEERALLVAAGGLLAQSLQRARMYEAEHALARDLQRGLLPHGHLAAPGVTIATRYRPVTSGLEIGGDFYDAIDLTDGRVALVIGDVQGHNPIAASLMGRLRTVVHAYAREGQGPAEVMTLANRWLADLNTDVDLAMFATCCFVIIDPAHGQLQMCRAGHPGPALAAPGGSPELLEHGDDLLLGVDADERYHTVTLPVRPGSVLVLATDGLLDDDGADPGCNVRALLGVLGDGLADEPEQLADALLGSRQRPTRHGDDIALMVARVDQAARPRLSAVAAS
jgi:serine phosphatase RsbU (regulator of sigma subunit)